MSKAEAMRAAIIGAALVLALATARAAPDATRAFHAPSSYPPAVTPWALGVRAKVMRALTARRPPWAQSVVVAFKVHRDGRVSDVAATGDARTAVLVTGMMARLRVAPFPPGVDDDIIPLSVKVSYVDNARRGKRR